MSKVLTEMVNHNHDMLIEEYLLNEMFRGTRAKRNLKRADKKANKADKVVKKLKDHLDFANKNQETLEGQSDEYKKQIIASDEEHADKLRVKIDYGLYNANKLTNRGEELLSKKYGKIVDKYTNSPRYRRKFAAKDKFSKLADPELFRKIGDERATKKVEDERAKEAKKAEKLAKKAEKDAKKAEPKVENRTEATEAVESTNKKPKVKSTGELKTKLDNIKASII